MTSMENVTMVVPAAKEWKPDVTVVIPTIQDRKPLLRRALKSVEKQTVKPAEVLVEMDEDRTGAASTRNRALAKVQTEWVAFLDDDDELLPKHLEISLKGLKDSGAELVYTYPVVLGQRDPLATVYRGQIVYPFGVPFGPDQEKYLRTVGNFIPVTHVCRTALVKQVGGLPEQGEFPVPEHNNSGDCEDYGLLLRLLDEGAKFIHVPEITWKYIFHDSNTQGRGSEGGDSGDE